jgi:hypothetical protein
VCRRKRVDEALPKLALCTKSLFACSINKSSEQIDHQSSAASTVPKLTIPPTMLLLHLLDQ